jgi:molybdenum cofactor cytidylyltransferase
MNRVVGESVKADRQLEIGGAAIGIVILAAGASTRMGTPKQLLLYQGRSFLRHTVEVAIASVCRPIVVVLGACAQQIQPEVSQLPVQVVENGQWTEGMSSSIRAGIKALSAAGSMEAAVLALCDQPFISSQIVNQLVETYQTTGKPIIASEYTGTSGVPALFSQTFFSELTALKGSEGAKQVMKKYAHQVFGIPFPKGAIDVDTPKDYEQLGSMTI